MLCAVSCAPTPYIEQRHVRYNLTGEGFLSPNLLQTVGRHEAAERTSRQACLEGALDQAVRRALSVMLHTGHDIPPEGGRVGSTALGGAGEFERSYPFAFTERDYVRAMFDYESLLRRSYLALQDARSHTDCMVVLRIEGPDLPGQIRKVPRTFLPEGLHATKRNRFPNRVPFSGEAGAPGLAEPLETAP